MNKKEIKLAQRVYLQNLLLFYESIEYRQEVEKRVRDGKGEAEEVMASDAVICAKSFYKEVNQLNDLGKEYKR